MKIALIALIPVALITADATAQVTSTVESTTQTATRGVDPVVQQSLDARTRLDTSRFSGSSSRINRLRERQAERAARRAAADVSVPEIEMTTQVESAAAAAGSIEAPAVDGAELVAAPELPSAAETSMNVNAQAQAARIRSRAVTASNDVTSAINSGASTRITAQELPAVAETRVSVPAAQPSVRVASGGSGRASYSRTDVVIHEHRGSRARENDSREAEAATGEAETVPVAAPTSRPVQNNVVRSGDTGPNNWLYLAIAGLLISLLLVLARRSQSRTRSQ